VVYRYLVTQPHLNAHGTLHGGILMKWVDEVCGMEARLKTLSVCATRHIESVDFLATARLGDIVEISVNEKSVGKTSITYDAIVRNAMGGLIAKFEKIVFVAIDNYHRPVVIERENN